MKKSNSTRAYRKGAQVQWNWMGRIVKGTVQKIYFKPISKTLRGFVFKRNGSRQVPAYSVKSQAGNEVSKLHSELKLSR